MSHLFLSRRRPDAGSPLGLGVGHRTGVPPIYVTSGSEVIARSIVALNIAIDSAVRGIPTVLVDADPDALTARMLAGGVAAARGARTLLLLPGRPPLPLVDTFREGELAARRAIVNFPGRRWLDGGEVDGIRNILLVTSPMSMECLHAFAIVKRAAAIDPRPQLGIVVAEVPDEEGGRSFYDRFAGLLVRHTPAAPVYCGYLSPEDRVSRSVRQRVPALLSLAEPGLSNRLRGIAAAVEAYLVPDTARRGALPKGATRHVPGLTDREVADALQIVEGSSTAGRV